MAKPKLGDIDTHGHPMEVVEEYLRSLPHHAKSVLYKTELCRAFAQTGHCRYGELCQFAHGQEELRTPPRHPKYKTEKCRTFWTQGHCPYGPRCRFIHDEAHYLNEYEGQSQGRGRSGSRRKPKRSGRRPKRGKKGAADSDAGSASASVQDFGDSHRHPMHERGGTPEDARSEGAAPLPGRQRSTGDVCGAMGSGFTPPRSPTGLSMRSVPFVPQRGSPQEGGPRGHMLPSPALSPAAESVHSAQSQGPPSYGSHYGVQGVLGAAAPPAPEARRRHLTGASPLDRLPPAHPGGSTVGASSSQGSAYGGRGSYAGQPAFHSHAHPQPRRPQTQHPEQVPGAASAGARPPTGPVPAFLGPVPHGPQQGGAAHLSVPHPQGWFPPSQGGFGSAAGGIAHPLLVPTVVPTVVPAAAGPPMYEAPRPTPFSTPVHSVTGPAPDESRSGASSPHSAASAGALRGAVGEGDSAPSGLPPHPPYPGAAPAHPAAQRPQGLVPRGAPSAGLYPPPFGPGGAGQALSAGVSPAALQASAPPPGGQYAGMQWRAHPSDADARAPPRYWVGQAPGLAPAPQDAASVSSSRSCPDLHSPADPEIRSVMGGAAWLPPDASTRSGTTARTIATASSADMADALALGLSKLLIGEGRAPPAGGAGEAVAGEAAEAPSSGVAGVPASVLRSGASEGGGDDAPGGRVSPLGHPPPPPTDGVVAAVAAPASALDREPAGGEGPLPPAVDLLDAGGVTEPDSEKDRSRRTSEPRLPFFKQLCNGKKKDRTPTPESPPQARVRA